MATGGQAENSSEEYIEYPCSVCEKGNTLSESGHYCLICKGFLCVNCLSGHEKYTPGHQVIAVTDKKFQNVFTERCVDHPDEVIEHYCGNHDVFLCNICERQGHRTCENVKQISDDANELIVDQKLQAVPDLLQSTLIRVTQVMDTIDNYVVNVQKKGHTYLKDLNNYEQTLIAKIRELTAKGRKSITHAQNKMIAAANERRKDCAKIKELMSKSLEDVKRPQTRTTHLVILKKKGQGLVNRADHLCRESEDSFKNAPFFYKPDTQIVEYLNGFSSLVTEKEQYTIGHRSDINTKISVDEQGCDIWACGRLSDGTLVVCDNDNKRLKRVDPSTNKVVDHCNMKGEPCGLCIIGPQEVAKKSSGSARLDGSANQVSAPQSALLPTDRSKAVADESKIVHIISTVKGLTPSRTVDMGQETDRLACHGGELFAGCGASLRIHDMSGKIITDISRNTDGQSMFSIITGIAVNQAGDRVFVSDYDNGLVCVSRDGRVVFRLSNDDMGLNTASGVTTDQRGMVMVAGCESHNVVQVTDEGRIVGEIMAEKDGICGPQCLYYDVEGRKLYVGGLRSQLGFELL